MERDFLRQRLHSMRQYHQGKGKRGMVVCSTERADVILSILAEYADAIVWVEFTGAEALSLFSDGTVAMIHAAADVDFHEVRAIL